MYLVMTPWGPADQLRARKLRPGPGRPSEATVRIQRERLLGATVAAVSELGYANARVADLIELSGVSRSTFYRCFRDKRDCFLQTVDDIAGAATDVMTAALTRDATWEEQVRGALEALVDLIVAQPAAARLCFVEVHAAGPEAIELIDRRAREFGREALALLERSPGRAGMPPDVVRAVLGGLRKVIHTRLRARREQELPSLVPALARWAASYEAPTRPLPRVLGPPPPARPIEPVHAKERVERAVTALVAERGLNAVAVSEIARRAGVSLSTFYGLYDDKQDAFLGALDRAHRLLLETTAEAFDAADDWPAAVDGALQVLFDRLSADTQLAYLCGAATWSGGFAALERLDSGLASFLPLVEGGYRHSPDTDPLVGEAIVASIAGLIYDHLRRVGADSLHTVAPAAKFIVLAPFLGTDAATAAIADRDVVTQSAGLRPASHGAVAR